MPSLDRKSQVRTNRLVRQTASGETIPRQGKVRWFDCGRPGSPQDRTEFVDTLRPTAEQHWSTPATASRSDTPLATLLRYKFRLTTYANRPFTKDSPADTIPVAKIADRKMTMIRLNSHSAPWRMMRLWFVLALTFVAQSAVAADGSVRCNRLRDESIRLYETGKSRQALPKLEEAQRCHPSSHLLLYIGLSQLELGKLDEAIVSLQRARDQAGEDTQLAELAERGMKEAEQQKQTQTAPSVNSAPKPDPERPQVWTGDPERIRRQQRLAGLVLLGAGLLGVAAGATLVGIDGIPTCSTEPRAIRCPQELNTWPGGVPLLVVGGGALVASTVLLVRSRPSDEAPGALSLTIGSPAVGIAARF